MTFRRITARTKLTFPCIVARQTSDGESWLTYVAFDESVEDFARCHYTHWLPFQWPRKTTK